MGILRFQLFGFPVQVQPTFWLLGLFFGLSGAQGVVGALAWVGVVFVSVLCHELGHAAAARSYGQDPLIVLHLLGGVTTWRPTRPMPRVPQIITSLAGPFFGFGLGALSYIAFRLTNVGSSLSHLQSGELGLGARTLAMLTLVNLFYGVINLLPVLPFDGGQVMAAALGPERKRLAAGLSLVFGLLVALLLFRLELVVLSFLFAMAGIMTFISATRKPTPPLPREALTAVLERSQSALSEGQHAEAMAMARAVLAASPAPELRRSAQAVLGWAALGARDLAAAQAALGTQSQQAELDPLLVAAVFEAGGELERAREVLSAARRKGDLRPEVSAFLIRVLLATGEAQKAVALTLEILDQVPREDAERVAERVLELGDAESATELRAALANR